QKILSNTSSVFYSHIITISNIIIDYVRTWLIWLLDFLKSVLVVLFWLLLWTVITAISCFISLVVARLGVGLAMPLGQGNLVFQTLGTIIIVIGLIAGCYLFSAIQSISLAWILDHDLSSLSEPFFKTLF